MLKEYKRNTNIGVGLGWIVVALANVPLRTGSFGGPVVGYLLYATGVIYFSGAAANTLVERVTRPTGVH